MKSETADILPCQVQAVWCDRPDEGGGPAISVWPEKREAEKRFLVTNAPDLVAPLLHGASPPGWHVVDIAELHRLLFPESAAASLEEMLPPAPSSRKMDRSAPPPAALRLWNLWLACSARLEALPAWVLENVAILCRERDEDALSALFAHQASLADPQESRKWMQTFAATVQRVERPALPTLDDCTALDPDLVASFLEAGGELARLVPGYEPRPGQIEMLRAIVAAFNEGRHLVVEAGTGIGKSLAYLLPAALWARLNDVPVVVSTNTKNLQSQLVQKDLPSVLQMLEETAKVPGAKPLAAAVIKGRSNYLCLRRLGQMIESGQFELDRPGLRLFAQALCWAAVTQDGDLDALLGGASIDASFQSNLTSTSEECPGRACRHYRRCFLQKARERALRANLVIANHSLVFTELDNDAPVSLPAHAQVIFDEAHNLEEAATSFFTREFSPSKLANVLKRLQQGRGKSRRGAIPQLRKRFDGGVICPSGPQHELMDAALAKASRAVEDVRRSGEAVFLALHPLLGKNDEALRYSFPPPPGGVPPEESPALGDERWKGVREKHRVFRDEIATLLSLLDSINNLLAKDSEDELDLSGGETNDLSGAIAQLTDFRDMADDILAGSDDSYVFWVDHARGPLAMGSANAAPLNVGEFLANRLFARKQTVVLCSATLSVGGRFNYIASRLGLDLVEPGRIRTCMAPSPFDYLSQCALLIPSYLPEPVAQDRSYVTELAHLICQLAEHYDGRTLCLFTSYEMLRQCARLAEGRLADLGIHLLVHGESGSRDRITRVFRHGDRCVLFGTHSFWEGVDVVGEALSCVVVARLPFSSPGDPIVGARCDLLEKEGRSAFPSLLLPAAVLRLRQGFGRLIRHRNDQGSVIIADTRILTKGYGATFRRSLPAPALNCPTQESLFQRLLPPSAPVQLQGRV